MTKDRKNNKLSQILAKYYQRQADKYSGMTENAEHVAKRRIGLWMLVFLVVIGAGIAVAVGMGLGKNPNDAGGHNLPTVIIDLPDFETFSNGYATLEYAEEELEDYAVICYQVERGIVDIMEEYHELLTKNYSYRLVQNSAMRDENNHIISDYYYVYMGEEIVSKFMVESGEESFALQLMIRATIADDNSGTVEIKAIPEIQKQEIQEKTSFVPDVLLTPDFSVFANGHAVSKGTVTQEDYVMMTYEFDEDLVEFIVGEYRNILVAKYPYQFVEEKELESNDGWVTREYYYSYTGKESVPEFLVTTKQGSTGIQLRIVVLTKENSEYGVVHLSCLKETIWQDNGEKTTYVPVKVTGVNLQLNGLLYNISSKLMNWIPEGYSFNYSFTTDYEGIKLKPVAGIIKSSNESVLQKNKEEKQFTAVGAGTAVISVTVDEFIDQKEITVYPVDRSTGTTMSLSSNAIEINSMESLSFSITTTHSLGENVPSKILPLVCSSEVECTWGEWQKLDSLVYRLEFAFEIDPKKFSSLTNHGIVFVLVRTDGNGNYDLNKDILDYQVVDFVWNVNE